MIKKWQKSEIELLKEYIRMKYPMEKISELLLRSIFSIRWKMSNIGIPPLKPRKLWTPDRIEKVKYLVNNNISKIEISREMEIPLNSVYKIMSKHKIKYKNENTTWTENEENQLKELVLKNNSVEKIKKILLKSETSIMKKMKCLNINTYITTRNKILKELKENGIMECVNCKRILELNNKNFPNLNNSRHCNVCLPLYFKKMYKNIKDNITLNSLLHIRYSSAKARAKSKNLPFNIDEPYLLELYNKQNGKCYYSDIKMDINIPQNDKYNFTLSLDKINPPLGYIKGNVVLCCWIVNVMKTNTKYEDFINLCKIIYDKSIKNKI